LSASLYFQRYLY